MQQLQGCNDNVVEIAPKLPWLDRLLPLLVLISMVIGVILGYYAPSVGQALNMITITGVSLPIAIGLLLMMYPILCKVKYESLIHIYRTKDTFKQLGLSFVLNWIIGPALMTALAWATLPDQPEFRSGVILVGVARCIAMVLIWNQLAKGDPEYCTFLVAFNSILQVFLYSPLAYFYVVIVGQGSSLHIDMWLVTKSVLIFLGIPLLAALATRVIINSFAPIWYKHFFLPIISPVSLLGLLFTILVMFSIQGRLIINNIANVVRVAVPLLLYFLAMFFATLLYCYKMKIKYELSVTQAFTAASNNFELAIAVAITTYGINSPEALATVIGPLIEVPVLLGLVYLALRWMRSWPSTNPIADSMDYSIQSTSLNPL